MYSVFIYRQSFGLCLWSNQLIFICTLECYVHSYSCTTSYSKKLNDLRSILSITPLLLQIHVWFYSFQSIDNRKVKLSQNFPFQDYITVILFSLEGYPVVTQVHLNKRVYMYKPILHGLISFCNNAQIRVIIKYWNWHTCDTCDQNKHCKSVLHLTCGTILMCSQHQSI